MLEEYGINVIVENKSGSSSGLIIDQSVKTGETLDAGNTMTLYI